jgi:hypothetical protein
MTRQHTDYQGSPDCPYCAGLGWRPTEDNRMTRCGCLLLRLEVDRKHDAEARARDELDQALADAEARARDEALIVEALNRYRALDAGKPRPPRERPRRDPADWPPDGPDRHTVEPKEKYL